MKSKPETWLIKQGIKNDFRNFELGFKFEKGTTREDVQALSDYMTARKNEIDHKLTMAEIIEMIAAFNGKIMPLTPYEKEIAQRYETLHKRMEEHSIDAAALLKLVKELIRQADKLLQEIPLQRKRFDEMMGHAILGHEGADKDVLLAGVPGEIVKEYDKTAEAFDKDGAAFEAGYTQWKKRAEKLEQDTLATQNLLHELGDFVTEFYDEQERFTLDCNTFDEDYTKFISAVRRQNEEWKNSAKQNDKLVNRLKEFRKLYKELIDYIQNWNPNPSWRMKNN